jgi:hypothetical protein
MIPNSSNINLRYDQFNQELGINKMADLLLENDLYILESITTSISGDLKELRIANRQETRALGTDIKAIPPRSVLSLSATDDNIYINDSEDKFITAGKYKTFIDRSQPITLWADLSFGVSFVRRSFPTDSEILAAAEEFLNYYDAPNGTLLYVRYIWTYHWTTKHKRSVFGGHYNRHHYLDYQYQDTYTRTNGSWNLKRRRQSNRI